MTALKISERNSGETAILGLEGKEGKAVPGEESTAATIGISPSPPTRAH